MPGRRYPRRSQQEAQSSHVRSVFKGGLDGASMVPYPVGYQQSQSGARAGGKCPQVLFFDEEFPATGGSQTISLAWLPIFYSEHVYLCKPLQGTYQRQEIAWTRDSGSRTINILPGMNSSPGDVIVVEYAYYEQVPGGEEASGAENVYWKLDNIVYADDGVGGAGNLGSIDVLGNASLYWVGGAAPLVAGSTGSAVIDSNPARPGRIVGNFHWDPAFDIEEFSTGATTYTVSFVLLLPGSANRTIAYISNTSTSPSTYLMLLSQTSSGSLCLSSSLFGGSPGTVCVAAGAGAPLVVRASITVPCWPSSGAPSGVAMALSVNGANSSGTSVSAGSAHFNPLPGIVFVIEGAGPGMITVDEVRVDWSGAYVVC